MMLEATGPSTWPVWSVHVRLFVTCAIVLVVSLWLATEVFNNDHKWRPVFSVVAAISFFVMMGTVIAWIWS